MNLLKKSLSVLAVAAMAVSLAGCGGSSSSSKSTEKWPKKYFALVNLIQKWFRYAN